MTGGVACVLFTDLVDSTELMAQLGDAAFDRLRTEHFAQLRRVVERRGGNEVKNTGDGILATFSSAVEAVAAAVDAQQATEQHGHGTNVPLALRVGLALGEVAFQDDDVFGTPVVEAARLVAVARPGQILVTSVVRMVAGSRCPAPFTDLGVMELKGLPEPVAVSEVAWEPQGVVGALPLPTVLAALGPVFVGRGEELGQLNQLWKEATAGERRVALLAGESGIGKTRLAGELAAATHAAGATVLAGRCDEDLGVPYQPFVEALRQYVGHAGDRRLGRHPGELTRLVPELAELVPGLPEPLRSDPETERYRLFDAFASWLSDTSASAPVLLVLDDLHWAAKPTLLLLRHVLRSPEPLRLLVVATYRDTDIGRGHPVADLLADLRRETGVERLSLGGLDAAGVLAFMEAQAHHHLDEDGESLGRAIWAETEGNPFFVGEVLRHLAESGAIVRTGGQWTATEAIEALGIPESVRDVIGRRLSRLSAAANRTLAVAAVVGAEFEAPVVLAAGRLEEDELVAGVDEALAARLLAEVPSPVPRYRFAHAVVRATLYEELSAAHRTAMHRRVAEAIETLHAGCLDDQLPALAHHWARAAAPAAETDRAVSYTAQAGDRALAQLAHDEAATYYRQALELLDVAPQPAAEARRLELTIALGDALRRAGDPLYRETLLEAARLAQVAGDAQALTRAALTNIRPGLFSALGTVDESRVAMLRAALDALDDADSPERARLLAALSRELVFSGSPERYRLAEEALAVARRLGEADTLAAVLQAHYYAVWNPDTLAERLARTEELQAVASEVEDPVTKALAEAIRYRALMEAGGVEEADRCLATYEAVATDLGQPFLRWSAAYLRCGRCLVAGQLSRAEACAGSARGLGVATGQPDAAAFFAQQLLHIRLEQGRSEEAEGPLLEAAATSPAQELFGSLVAHYFAEQGRMEDAGHHFDALARTDFSTVPTNQLWLTTMCCAAMVAARLGDGPRAGVLAGLLRPYADQVAGIPIDYLGPVTHFLGLLAATAGQFQEAEAHFADATRTAERVGAPLFLARTRLEWARTLLRRDSPGDADRGRSLLDEVVGSATELGLVAVERQAHALLDGEED
jgi:class 3 adenylate cyclase